MNKIITFLFSVGLVLSNGLLGTNPIYVTLPKGNNTTNNFANMKPEDVLKNLQKNLSGNVNVQGVQTGKIAYIASKDADPNFRVNVINEELAKVKIPTEPTDELLFLAKQQEQQNPGGNVMGNFLSFLTNHSMITIKNNSNLAIECALTALHTTSQKTALFSRKYNKYITQTAVSIPVIIKPQSAGMLTLDPTGANIANTETVIAITVAAVQMTSKKHVLERDHFKDETILVHDITTDSWISNKKIALNTPQGLEFPNNFVHGLTQTQVHEGPNYYNLIAYMRACERIYENSSEQVEFPAAYFNPDYISRLDEKELNNVYQFVMKKFYQKSIPMPVGLTGLLNCGKYNFVAKAIGQIFLSVVLLLTGGGGIAALTADAASTVQTIVDSSIAIGQGVESLKAKGRG